MRNRELTDEEIVARVVQGDRESYRYLVERYQKVVFNVMFRATGSMEEAADLTQDVFLKVYEKMATFKPGKKFFPWLYTIALNHARNFRRRNSSNDVLSLNGMENSLGSRNTDSSEEVFSQGLDVERVYRTLEKVPLVYREAVILRYRDGRSMKEIAEMMDISQSAAKMRVYRGLEKVRELLFGGEAHEER